ncbi:hypothetical protein JCM3774_005880 [Rhodotorula dairenensis]
METGRRPRKRVKAAADFAVESYSRLVASSLRLQQLVQDASSTSAALQDELAVASDRLARFEAALHEIDASAGTDSLPDGWRDQLDSLGTSVWNQSTARRNAINQLDEDQRNAAKNEVAASSLAQLSLATKTACAFLDAGQPTRAEPLISQTGEIASTLASTELAPSDESARKRVKVLLAYYCCRIRLAVAHGTTPVAGWLRDRAKTLLGRNEASWREVELLARTAYDTGITLLRDDKSGDANARPLGTESSIEWLRFSLSLLEGGQPSWTSPLQVAALKALAHAYLTASPAHSRWDQAEETLIMVLEFEPEDAASLRRLLKIVIARGASDSDIEEIFMRALKHTQEEDVYSVVAALELLPEKRKSTRLGILLSICKRASLESNASAPLSQLFAAAFLLASDSDYAQIEAALREVQAANPEHRVNEASAFTVTTSIWRIAEKAEKEGRLSSAAGWSLLGVEPIFSKIGTVLQGKLARKSVLAYVQAGDTDAAQTVLRSPILQGDHAKNHFVKFYASGTDADQALGAIHDLVRAPDVNPSLLLWAHKVALERGGQELASQILRAVAAACQDTSEGRVGNIDIDVLVLTRSIIRALVRDFKNAEHPEQRIALLRDISEQLESGMQTIRTRSARGLPGEDLGKELVWLYKTAYNLAAEYQHEWDAASSSGIFRLVVELMSYSLRSGTASDPEVTPKLVACRLALLSRELDEARRTTAAGDRVAAYTAVLIEAREVLALLAQAGPRGGDKTEAKKKAATLAVLVEALCELGKWEDVLDFALSFEGDSAQPLSALKLLVGIVIDPESACPHETLSKILRKTLDVLYRGRDVDQPRMAIWLRAIVLSLLHRRDLEEALKYIENAAHFIGQPQSTYPSEEADWMAATAWDEGVELYAAASPRSGHAWCQVAVTIAQVTNGLLAAQWQSELAELDRRYGGGDTDIKGTTSLP